MHAHCMLRAHPAASAALQAVPSPDSSPPPPGVFRRHPTPFSPPSTNTKSIWCLPAPGALQIDDTVVISVTGQQLVAALENGVSQYPKLEGRFPQVRVVRSTGAARGGWVGGKGRGWGRLPTCLPAARLLAKAAQGAGGGRTLCCSPRNSARQTLETPEPRRGGERRAAPRRRFRGCASALTRQSRRAAA